MQQLHLSLRHDDFGLISDRSSRQILKQLGKAVRAAQLAAIDEFIFELDLPYSELRAIQDRVQSEAQRAAPFFLQRLEKGSLVLAAVASAALVGLLVKAISDVLCDDEAARVAVLRKLNGFLNLEWGMDSGLRVAGQIEDRGLGSNIVVDDYVLNGGRDEVTLQVRLATDPNAEPPAEPATAESVQREIDAALRGSPTSPPA